MLLHILHPCLLLYFLLEALCFSSSLSLSGSAEAVVGRSDRKGSREAARLVFCAAGRSCHRGFGDAHWRPLWKSDAAGQLNQPPWRTNRHGPHMGQNAQLQRGGVRLPVNTHSRLLDKLSCKLALVIYSMSLDSLISRHIMRWQGIFCPL